MPDNAQIKTRNTRDRLAQKPFRQNVCKCLLCRSRPHGLAQKELFLMLTSLEASVVLSSAFAQSSIRSLTSQRARNILQAPERLECVLPVPKELPAMKSLIFLFFGLLKKNRIAVALRLIGHCETLFN